MIFIGSVFSILIGQISTSTTAVTSSQGVQHELSRSHNEILFHLPSEQLGTCTAREDQTIDDNHITHSGEMRLQCGRVFTPRFGESILNERMSLSSSGDAFQVFLFLFRGTNAMQRNLLERWIISFVCLHCRWSNASVLRSETTSRSGFLFHGWAAFVKGMLLHSVLSIGSFWPDVLVCFVRRQNKHRNSGRGKNRYFDVHHHTRLASVVVSIAPRMCTDRNDSLWNSWSTRVDWRADLTRWYPKWSSTSFDGSIDVAQDRRKTYWYNHHDHRNGSDWYRHRDRSMMFH